MTQNLKELNDLFVNIYSMISKTENLSMQSGPFSDLSLSEVHALERMMRDGARAKSMGEVAAELGITVATLSVTVKRLYAKGYVERRSDLADRRLVLVGLTEKGRRAARVHQYFHGLMMKRALGKLDDAQMEVLKTALVELNQYFEDYLASQGVFCKAESK